MKRNFKKYLNPVFIETGTYRGDGVKSAIHAGFRKIYSIELSERYCLGAKHKFKDVQNVVILYGDSVDVLPRLLNDIDDVCTFWLDGHFSGGDTASGKYPVPLMQELLAIRRHHIKTHTILIDDMRLLRGRMAQWSNLPYGEKDIKNILKTINFNYDLSYTRGKTIDDVLIAKPK